MGFFGRKQAADLGPVREAQTPARPAVSPPDLDLVDELAEAVAEEQRSEIPGDARIALSVGYMMISGTTADAVSQEALTLGNSVARLGFFARRVEVPYVVEAELPQYDPGLREAIEQFRTRVETPLDVCSKMAESMAAIDPLWPTDEDVCPSNQILGLSATVRNGVAKCFLGQIGSGEGGAPPLPAGVKKDDVIRTWKFGYFVHVLQEAMPGELGIDE